jgi:aspartate aminotransferase
MFENVTLAPPDPIFGLIEAFEQDDNPAKISLCAGVYQDASGRTPIFSAVKKAEALLLERESTKNYLEIAGSAPFRGAVQSLLLSGSHDDFTDGRAVTIQTPGGTGGLRVAGDFLRNCLPARRIWLSDPTWVNHGKLFAAAGFDVAPYRYYDNLRNCLDFDAMLEDIRAIPRSDLVLLHGCCHNPTGWDPSQDQWERLTEIIATHGLLPVVDLAYQGLGRGLADDAAGVTMLADRGVEMLVACSYSKNFGLYNERVGALTAFCADAEMGRNVLSQLKSAVRANYSNPPAHGAGVVATVLGDDALRAEWEKELGTVRERIREMRHLLAKTLREKGAARDFSFITQQHGMFSYTGLSKSEVAALREKYSIYIVGSGRINVAGLTEENIMRVAGAIVDVIGTS